MINRLYTIATLALTQKSLLVQARNDNNGSDQANAATITLLDNDDVVLTLHTYNSQSSGEMELHGDIELRIKMNSDPDNRQVSFQEYGWCLEIEQDLWDCMIVRTNLIPEFIEADENYNADFQLIDGYMKPSEFFNVNSTRAGEIQLDDNWEIDMDASLNWRLIAGKSYKQCELDGIEP